MIGLGRIKRNLYLVVARYFRWWSDKALRRWQPRVIAITGSVGKTTLLHLLEQQLGNRAHYSHNANSAFGVAFDIVGLRGITGSKWRWLWLAVAVPYRALTSERRKEFYVVEIDGERPDEVEFLASWLQPEVTLWVSLGNSHAVYFDAQVASGRFENVEDAIANEFARLPEHTTQLVIANGDVRLIRDTLEPIRIQTDLVSLDELSSYEVWPERSQFTLNGQTFAFSYPMPREIGVQLLMLSRLAQYLEIEPQTDMSRFVMPPGRNSHFAGINDTHLIDSSYNAHLISMQSTLDMFDQMAAEHKWVVLGDMIEQGASERDQHEQLARRVLKSDAERVILIGRRLRDYALPILSEHDMKATAFDSPRDALDYIRTELNGGETLLFKGSQYLEWLVEKLLANPDDRKLLCRQEPAARRRREKRGLL